MVVWPAPWAGAFAMVPWSAMASRLLRYIRRFGPWTGTQDYLRTRRRTGEVALRAPGVSHPVRVRAGSSDRRAFEQVFLDREYDFPVPGRPRFIVDAGANIGCASVWFASRFPSANIVAVEPDPGNHALLDRNVAPWGRVRTVQAAVWSRAASLTIDNPGDEPWAYRVREARPGEAAFPAVSIGGLLAEAGEEFIDVLKLDVEGAEREIFADPGCDTWLSRTRLLFVELHDRFGDGCGAALESAAARHPFRRFELGENVVLVRYDLPA